VFKITTDASHDLFIELDGLSHSLPFLLAIDQVSTIVSVVVESENACIATAGAKYYYPKRLGNFTRLHAVAMYACAALGIPPAEIYVYKTK
jgi:hypothetical protein